MAEAPISPTKAYLIAVAVVCLIRVPLLIVTKNWDSLIVFAIIVIGVSALFFGYLKFKSPKS